MTDRGLSALNEAHVDGRVVRPRALLQLEYDSPTGTLYITDNVGPLVANDWEGVSRTWTGVGDLGSIDTVEEARDVSPYALSFTLTGIDSTIASQVLTDDSVMRKAKLLMVYIDTDGSIVDQPHKLFKGSINEQKVSVGEESAIQITAESFLIALTQNNGRLLNDADQQDEFSGDLGFEYQPQIENAKISWGGDSKNYGNGSPGGYSGPMRGGGGGGGARMSGRGTRPNVR